MRLCPRTAIITGASSGIGAELARRLGTSGVRVGLTARRAEPMDAIAAEIRAKGGTAAVATADAADPIAVKSAAAKLKAELGPIDLLVANAGVALFSRALKFSAEDVDRMIRVNLISAAYAIESVLPEMLERGQGHIVGISSLAAYRGLPFSPGYCASKAGLTALFEGLRIDLLPKGIVVTTVHPGYIRTPMTEGEPGPQPFLMDLDPAVRIILKGIAAGSRRVDFPWRAALTMSVVSLLPGFIYDRIARRVMPE